MTDISTEGNLLVPDTYVELFEFDASMLLDSQGAAGEISYYTNTPVEVDSLVLRSRFNEPAFVWLIDTGHSVASLYEEEEKEFKRITTSILDTAASNITGGYYLEIPASFADVFSGKTVQIKVKARSTDAVSDFSLGYSTFQVGHSGWQAFIPTASWAWYTFTYAVPPQSSSGPDFFGLQGNTNGTIDISEVIIETITPNFLAWQGNNYFPLPLELTGVDERGDGTAPNRPSLVISNANQFLLAAVLSLGDLIGMKVTRWRTFYKFTDNGSEPNSLMHYPKEQWVLTKKVAQSKNGLQYEISSPLDRPGVRLPRKQILRDFGFPGVGRTRIR